tara:strand:- start:12555 stop:14078 length:1524 start_codon:yes stop_codon:yes gene_type:complete
MSNAKRVMQNTVFLYIKMILSMIISLYSVRLILKALGSQDYGIFSLVAGVIAMLSFLNGAMTTSSQRYISFYLGAKNKSKILEVFKSTVFLHFVIAIVIVVVLEVLGLFIFDGFLNIPGDRIETAKIVYHCMVISTFFTINAVPYDSLINAHEHLLFDSIVGIFESIMRLVIAISISFYFKDRLILFGVLMAVLTIVIRVVKTVYCKYKFDECVITLDFQSRKSPFFKEMFSFASWNLFGGLCSISYTQGIAVVLNLFLGTIVNAAYGIALQVSAQLFNFSSSMLKALNPQIVKSEGVGDRERLINLTLKASKFSFFLLSLFAIPLIFEMPFVLNLWLKNVPEYTVVFCQIILIRSMIDQLSSGLKVSVQSVGKIKLYQSVVGVLVILNVPLVYVLLKFNVNVELVLFSSVIMALLTLFVRLRLTDKLVGIDTQLFFKKVILLSIYNIIPTFLVGYMIMSLLDSGYVRLLVTFILCCLTMIIMFFKFSLEKDELQLFEKLKSKLIKK